MFSAVNWRRSRKVINGSVGTTGPESVGEDIGELFEAVVSDESVRRREKKGRRGEEFRWWFRGLKLAILGIE